MSNNGHLHRHQHRRKIRKNAQARIGKVKHRPVHARRFDGQIPRPGYRGAAKHIGQHAGHVVAHRNKHDRPHGQMEPTTGEDAQVEDEHRHLGEASTGTINNSRDHIQLTRLAGPARRRCTYLQKLGGDLMQWDIPHVFSQTVVEHCWSVMLIPRADNTYYPTSRPRAPPTRSIYPISPG